MEKIAKKLLDEGKITQAEYDIAKGMTKEAFAANIGKAMAGGASKMKVGVGDFLFGSHGPSTKKIRDIAQAAALTGIGGMIVMQAAQKAKDLAGSIGAYDKMLEKNPSLSEYESDKIKDFYTVVKTFSPKAASNPLVAGALVNKMLQFGGVDHKLVQDIANIQGDKRDILSDIVTKAGQSFVGFDFPKAKDE